MKTRIGPFSPVTSIPDEQIRSAVLAASSWGDIAVSLGFNRCSGGVRKKLRARAEAIGLSIDHLPEKGAGWNSGHRKNPLDNVSVNAWKAGELCGHTGKTLMIKPFVREYMKAKAGYKCEKCGWGEINPSTGKVPLQTNHIDGNSANTVESNLESICPNCHSLTPTFMNLNKGRGRPGR